jgi:hypothetical protein
MLLGDVVKGDKQITQGEDGLEDIWVKKDKRNRTIPRGHIQPWTQVHPTTELSGGEIEGPTEYGFKVKAISGSYGVSYLKHLLHTRQLFEYRREEHIEQTKDTLEDGDGKELM